MFSGDGYSKMFGEALGADEEVGESVGCRVGLTVIRIGQSNAKRVSMKKQI